MKNPRIIIIADHIDYKPQLKLLSSRCEVKAVFVKDYAETTKINYELGIRRTYRYTTYIPSNSSAPFELIAYLSDNPLLSIVKGFNQPSRPKDVIVVSRLENQYKVTLALSGDENREYYALRSSEHCIATTVKARVTQTNSGSLDTNSILNSLLDLCAR